MNNIFLLICGLFGLFNVSTSQTIELELLNEQEFEEVKIDSMLSVQLPISYTKENVTKNSRDIALWMGTTNQERSFIVTRTQIDDLVCIENQRQLKEYYVNIVREWKDSEVGMKIKYNSRFIDKDVYQGVLEYEQLGYVNHQNMHHDYRLILLQGTYYKIGMVQPKDLYQKSVNDLFFKSINIAPAYTGSGQYLDCVTTFDYADGSNNQNSSTYNFTYNLTTWVLRAMCFVVVPLLVVGLGIYFLVSHNRNRRKSKELWDERTR